MHVLCCRNNSRMALFPLPLYCENGLDHQLFKESTGSTIPSPSTCKSTTQALRILYTGLGSLGWELLCVAYIVCTSNLDLVSFPFVPALYNSTFKNFFYIFKLLLSLLTGYPVLPKKHQEYLFKLFKVHQYTCRQCTTDHRIPMCGTLYMHVDSVHQTIPMCGIFNVYALYVPRITSLVQCIMYK